MLLVLNVEIPHLICDLSIKGTKRVFLGFNNKGVILNRLYIDIFRYVY